MKKLLVQFLAFLHSLVEKKPTFDPDAKVHETEPKEMHCPTCWRTAADLTSAGKLQVIQGYVQCGYHYADLDYGELPPAQVAKNQDELIELFRNLDKHESTICL